MSKCKVKTCIDESISRGLCEKHYCRNKRALRKVISIKAGRKCACGCGAFISHNAMFVKGHKDRIGSIITICKNPNCKKEFMAKNRSHSYCSPVCREFHYYDSGRRQESTKKYHQSKKGKEWFRRYAQRENVKTRVRAHNQTEEGKMKFKRYAQSEKGKLSHRIASKKYRENNPEKVFAHRIAKQIERTLCIVENCGKLGERHHPSYEEPKKVISLCSKHHTELHRNQLILN